MTRIRATCPMCGEVDLRPTDIELEIVRDVIEEIGAGSCYRFSCPTCTELVQKPADERIARLLTTGGVAVVEAPPVPTAPPHPEVSVDGPPLTLDDLLALHVALQQDDWFATLQRMTD